MLKSKIYFTVFAVYEIIAVILLHDMYTCTGMFSARFCQDSGFKYFLFCFALPLLIFVIAMWLDAIFARRHRTFLQRAGDMVSDVASDLKTNIGRNFNYRDIDKYLAAAILLGIKKYSASHPAVRRTVREIIDGVNDDLEMNVFETDDVDEYDDSTNDSYTDSNTGAARNSATRKTRSNATNGGSRKNTPHGNSVRQTSYTTGRRNTSR